MKKTFLLLGFILLILNGCYRPATKEVVIVLPEAEGNPAELTALKEALRKEESFLREGLTFYKEIKLRTDDSALVIVYNSEYLADMNLIHKLNQFGYRVGDLPGDPVKRAAFLKKNNLP